MGRDFNKEMDRYLDDKRRSKASAYSEKKGFLRGLFSREAKQEEERELEEIETAIETIDEAEETAVGEDYEALEEARESFLTRLFEKMRFFKRREEIEEVAENLEKAEESLEEQRVEMEEETKEALKIATKWLGKLPKRYRDEFKESEDYKKYKAILKKYNLAK